MLTGNVYRAKIQVHQNDIHDNRNGLKNRKKRLTSTSK